ncbi:MAG: extracellular solute-binding protein [Promethearchaeota archaeon]
MKSNRNKKLSILLIGFLMLFSAPFYIFPATATSEPKLSQSTILNIIVPSYIKPPISDLIPDFLNSRYGGGISDVNVISSGDTSDQQLTYLQTHLAAGDTSLDVMALDAIWTALFVENGWLENLDFHLIPYEMNNYIAGIVDSCEYQGSYWAFPYSLNFGALYYRKDLLTYYNYTTADIDTWAELNATANDILHQENNPNLVGYIGQFDNYEGGTVNFQEWIGSNGVTNIFDSNGNPLVNQTDAIDALAFLKGLIAPPGSPDLINSKYIISRDALTYNEGTTHNTWLAGQALFARNWPYMYSLTLDSPYNTSFGVAPIPTFHGYPDEKSSVAAGSIFGISSFSQHKDAAFNLTKWLCLNYSQYYNLQTYGYFPALKETYSSLPPGFEYVSDFYAASDVTLARPKHPEYPEISAAISQRFSEIISCQKSAAQGLSDLQQDIIDIIPHLSEIHVEIVERAYSSENFNLTFYISNSTGPPINDATIQIWWNGINVTSNIKNNGNGNYSISLTPIIILLEQDPILLNMTISALGYKDRYFKTYIAVHSNDLIEDKLKLDIIKQSFSSEYFNMTFFIHNRMGSGIDNVIIQMWWNGIDVSADIQSMENGLYFISLDAITVVPGEEPILLNMTISASGYANNYYEKYISVDPDSLLKGEGEPTGEFPLTLIIVISSLSGGTLIALAGIYWLRKRKKRP